MDYNATITTPRAPVDPDDDTDRLMTALAAYHPAIAPSPLDPDAWEVVITYPAHDLAQALSTAQMIGATLGGLTALEVCATEAWDRRATAPAATEELVSVAQAADALGVTPQAVRERLASGSLPGRKVGRAWLVPARALRA